MNISWLYDLMPFYWMSTLYIDVPEHLADSLFEKHGVKVKFEGDYRKPGEEFIFVTCWIRKRDIEAYQRALEELGRKMILCGHPGYEAFCRKAVEQFMEWGAEVKGA